MEQNKHEEIEQPSYLDQVEIENAIDGDIAMDELSKNKTEESPQKV